MTRIASLLVACPVDTAARRERHAACTSLVLTAALLAGCANGPAFVAPQPPAAGESAVYLYRPFVVNGAAMVRDVRLNGVPVGRLPVMAYLHLRVPAQGAAAASAPIPMAMATDAINLQVQGCEPLRPSPALAPGAVAYVEALILPSVQAFGGRYYASHICQLIRRTESEALPIVTGLRRAD